MTGQLAPTRHAPRSTGVDRIDDLILAIDFEELSFEAAYAETMGHLMASDIIRSHALKLVQPGHEASLVSGAWPGPTDARTIRFSLDTALKGTGPANRELIWEIRRGPRFAEATHRTLPLVVRLLGLKWVVAIHEGGIPEAVASHLESGSAAPLYRLTAELSPILNPQELIERFLHGLHPYLGHEMAGIALREGEESYVAILPKAPLEPDTMKAFSDELEGPDAVAHVFEPLNPDGEPGPRPFEARLEHDFTSEDDQLHARLVLARSVTTPYGRGERVRFEALVQQLDQILTDRATVLELERQARTDAMTDLYNYRSFRSLLSQEFSRARRHRMPLSLLVLDVDHFKEVNDTLGHPRGDAALRSLARLLKETKRKEDIVARYGGEEFVMILPQVGTEGAHRLANRLREAVEGTRILEERPVTVSVGVATLDPEGEVDEDQLIFLADQALVRAKKKGRNRVEYSDGTLRLLQTVSRNQIEA